MNAFLARGLCAHLLAIAMIFQGVELWQMRERVAKIWSRENLANDFRTTPWLSSLLSEDSIAMLAWVLIGIGGFAFLHANSFAFFILLLAHLLICIRFRGSVNGGSDSMTAMILIGLIIAYMSDRAARYGLLFIAVQLFVSYSKAALSKARVPAWRNGDALPAFFQQSFFPSVRSLTAPKWGGWVVIGSEFALAFAPLLFSPIIGLMFFFAIGFHFTIYWLFGLNRFFWVWLAAWPSFFYVGAMTLR